MSAGPGVVHQNRLMMGMYLHVSLVRMGRGGHVYLHLRYAYFMSFLSCAHAWRLHAQTPECSLEACNS